MTDSETRLREILDGAGVEIPETVEEMQEIVDTFHTPSASRNPGAWRKVEPMYNRAAPAMSNCETTGTRQQPMIAIDFERSGIDAGTIGYTIKDAEVRNLSDSDFEDLLQTIQVLESSLERSRVPSIGD